MKMLRKSLALLFVITLGAVVFGSSAFAAFSTYTIGGKLMEFDSAIVYYPTGSNGPFPATTMSGGWTNTKEDMAWICEKLVEKGFIVMCFTPQRRLLALPWIWERGANACYNTIISENSNSSSPIYKKVNTNQIAMCGFSMGGGGVVNATNNNVTGVKVTVAMAPWETCTLSPRTECTTYTSAIKTPIFIFGGTDDRLVYDAELNNLYDNLPYNTEKLGAIWEGMTHYDLFGVEGAKGFYRDDVAAYMTAFLKVYLVGDTSYQTYLNGAQLQDRLDDGVFSMYKYNNTTYVESE